MPKHDVLTVKTITHIPVDPGDMDSVEQAVLRAEHLGTVAKGLGQTTTETRLNRVPVPEPEPETTEPVVPEAPEDEPPEIIDDGPRRPDDLDIPDHLRYRPGANVSAAMGPGPLMRRTAAVIRHVLSAMARALFLTSPPNHTPAQRGATPCRSTTYLP